MNLSKNMQDYLKAILLLSKEDAAATTSVASHLGVSPASATAMIKKLAALKLVDHQSYKGVTLTHAGRKIALEILRHHRLIETYLAEALGYPWDEVHEEAERLEHHISEEFEERIARVLGHPQYDPHGDPIPTKDGRMPPTPSDRLSDCDVRDAVVVRRVSSHDPAMLRLLAENGIGIGCALRVLQRNEEQRTITVRNRRTEVVLSLPVCQNIFVDR